MATADQSLSPQPVKTSWGRLALAFLLGVALTFVADHCLGTGDDTTPIQPNPYVRVTAENLTVRPNPVPGATAVEVAVFGPGGQMVEQRGLPGDTFNFDLIAQNLNPRQQVIARYYKTGPTGGEVLYFLDSMRTEDSFLGGDVDMGYHESAATERTECPPALTGRVDLTATVAPAPPGGFFRFGDLAAPETYEIQVSGCTGAPQKIQIVVSRRLDGEVVVEVFDNRSHECYARTYMACNNTEIVLDETGCRLYVQEAVGEVYVVGCTGCTVEVFD